METRFVVAPSGSIETETETAAAPAAPDPDLLNALARGHALRELVMDRPELPLIEIAREHGLNPTKAARLLRLAFLSPRIVTSILNGQQPADLSVRRLLKGDALPMDWTAQERALGYAA